MNSCDIGGNFVSAVTRKDDRDYRNGPKAHGPKPACDPTCESASIFGRDNPAMQTRFGFYALVLLLHVDPSIGFYNNPKFPVSTGARACPMVLKDPALHLRKPRAFRSGCLSIGTKQCRMTIAYGGINKIVELEMPSAVRKGWEVHKFGGASLADAALYRTVGDLLIAESKGHGDGAIPTVAVVSAMSGTTDQLIGVVNAALKDPEEAKKLLAVAVDKQLKTLRELVDASIAEPVERNIRKDSEDIIGVLRALKLLRTVPSVTLELVTGFGEVWSAQTLNAYLLGKGVPCDWLDAREVRTYPQRFQCSS